MAASALSPEPNWLEDLPAVAAAVADGDDYNDDDDSKCVQ